MTGILNLLAGSISSAIKDGYFNLTTLLLSGNGTNGAQNNTFLDSSSNNFTITRNGNTTQGTFTPFSQTGWGNYFAAAADFISIPDSSNVQLGSGDFTLEFWTYLTSSFTTQWITGKGDAATGAGTALSFYGTLVQFYSGSTNYDITIPSGTWVTNTWSHVALVRTGTSSGNLRLYVNGQLINSASIGSNTINTGGSNPLKIGSYAGTGPICYISNYRLVKGTALYTSAFTPPTSPLTAISGTTLLTCQSNRFLDASSNNAIITASGTPSVQAFSPFAPTAAYDSSVVGGSGYFDGTGDYLTAPANAAYAMGTGDFTIECWVNTSLTSARYIFDIRPSASQCIGAYISSNTLYINSGSTLDISASTAFVLGAWNHFAYVRSGSGTNNVSIFLNGSRVYQRTDTTNYSTNPILYIGADNGGSYSNGGYISGFRVLKGTAQYSGATYTVPTAPPTAITNTQLLLNFTNAGITDATAKNDLETVGNAQISTTQSKFGGSSMYFDGKIGRAHV